MSGLPTTSLSEGYDTSNQPVKLGDIDTDGYMVRYIDPDGLGHESRKMAEFTMTFGRFEEALTGHLVRGEAMPDPGEFIAEWCSPEHAAEAMPWMRKQTETLLMLRRLAKEFPTLMDPDFPLPAGVEPAGVW